MPLGSNRLYSDRVDYFHFMFPSRRLAYILALVASNIIPFQQPLRPVLPTIEGNVDYSLWREQILRIDQMLLQGGFETQFLEGCIQDWIVDVEAKGTKISAKAQRRFQDNTRKALRCNIARILLNEDFRGFSVRLADSPLLQNFCLVSQMDTIRVPSKSTLERFSKWVPESRVRELVASILRLGADHPQELDLAEALDLETCFLDTSCVEANIHFPVDWVLFRDATRTLMKAVRLIRDKGLRHRMEEPEEFLRRMNRLCIEMTHARTQADSQSKRKAVLRKMDRLLGTVRKHAQRYRDLLEGEWEKTGWTRPQTEQVLRRMDQVLDQLPAARHQAKQRILEGELVDNAEKILSLYEPEVCVIVRRKAGAEVEFGNTLLLGESRQGLIIDWEYYAESAPADSKLTLKSVERMEKALGRAIAAVVGDRGFDSQQNREELDERGTYNGICPRAPKDLRKRMGSAKFRELQTRRGQTEGRIAVFKRNILGGPLLSKGFEHRELTVSWAVLSHNLWVLARLPRAKRAAKRVAA